MKINFNNLSSIDKALAVSDAANLVARDLAQKASRINAGDINNSISGKISDRVKSLRGVFSQSKQNKHKGYKA